MSNIRVRVRLWILSVLCILSLCSCRLTSYCLRTLPSLGDIQPCRRPVSWNRLTLPVPERLFCPTGPWQRFPYAHWRRTCTHWNVNVLLLRHFACTGMNPRRDYRDASLVVWQMLPRLFSVVNYWWNWCLSLLCSGGGYYRSALLIVSCLILWGDALLKNLFS